MLISRIKNNINKNKKSIKKSQILLFGSLLIFGGIVAISWNNLLSIKDEVYSDMLIGFSDTTTKVEEVSTPITNEVVSMDKKKNKKKKQKTTSYTPIDYSKYLGVLRIPKIYLKRGFYNTDSKYNDIQYNVTLLKGSTMPNVKNGNLILIAHSGDAWISFFEELYKVKVGDKAYIDYKGKTYTYTVKKIYTVPKNGFVSIRRNYKKTTLTLITCTKGSSKKQTVYICELD